MLLCAIDPSFTKTGITVLDLSNKQIDFYTISPVGTNDNFLLTLNRASFIADKIEELITSDTIVITEEPLFSSIKASSLGILAGILYSKLNSTEKIKELYSIKPSYVAHLNTPIAKKFKLNKKQASLYVVNSIIDKLREVGFTININNPDKLKKDGTEKVRKLSHDEAESFLILLVLLRYKGLINSDIDEFLFAINERFKNKQNIEKLK